ncbi:MAG TPA: TetR/AcrR family transcriptional regulator [Acidimicrobiales bacterium]|nr:TetR/AcrR family transcriptional regulator [Acidimicrobiales bacterium]
MSQTTLDQTADPASTSKGARTRQAILAAAIARFGREGFRATSVADIARDAGVGGTVAYTYFPNKEALFLAAIDEDAAGLIRTDLEAHDGPEWRHTLLFFVAGAVDHHPLARRLLAGLEPEVTGRVLEIPALADLRRACGQRLRDDQQTGRVRTDIDTDLVGNGVVAILLSLLMSIVQVGDHSALPYADAVDAVFRAAIEPPRADTGP